MDKQKAIKVLKNGHKEFKEVLDKLDTKTINSTQAVGNWTVHDVTAHIAAWYWEFVREIDSFLADKPILNLPSGDDAFNAREVAKRKDKKLSELIDEWEKSFDNLVNRIEQLTDKEWNHVCEGKYWPDGTEVSMRSLLASYQDKRQSHEGEHARELKKFFKI